MRCKRIRRLLRRRRAITRFVNGFSEARIEVTADENGALRGAAATLLTTGIPQIAAALELGDRSEARRLRWRYECLFRLLDDLGWSEDEAASATAITMSPCELAIALNEISRHSRKAIGPPRDAVLTGQELLRHETARAACKALRRQLPLVKLVGLRGW